MKKLTLVFLAVVLLNLFEKESSKTGIFAAATGGLLLDIFSDSVFGFWLIISVLSSLLIKLILKKHVRISFG